MYYVPLLTDASILVSGLMAGLYLGWAISVMPGLSLLPDADYQTAFQKLNRAILNPRFKTLFSGALVLPPMAAGLSVWDHGFAASWLLVLASACLIVGHGAMTALGNIPMNVALDRLDMTGVSREDMIKHRSAFEGKWRALHWGRTVATSVAFALLLAGRLA